MKVVSKNSLKTLVVKDSTVYGFRGSFKMSHDQVNTDISSSDYDLDKIKVHVLLHRNGSTTTVMNGSLATLIDWCAFNEDALSHILMGNPNVLVEKGASVKQIAQIPVNIHFGGVINLSGEDKLEITLKMESGCVGANIDTAEIQFSEVEGFGVEQVTPTVQIQTISDNSGVWEESLGSNVKDVMFISNTATSPFEKDKVLTNVTLTSNEMKKALNLDWDLLTSKRYEDLYNSLNINERKQNFLIADSVLMNNVKLALTLEASNVTGSKNYVVYFKGEVTR